MVLFHRGDELYLVVRTRPDLGKRDADLHDPLYPYRIYRLYEVPVVALKFKDIKVESASFLDQTNGE